MSHEHNLNNVRKLLQERKQQLNHSLNHQNTDVENNADEVEKEFTSYDNHPADQGSNLFEQEKELTLQEHMQKELNEVYEALQAIDDGTYGRCVVCNKEIRHERLLAAPTTKYCIDHA